MSQSAVSLMQCLSSYTDVCVGRSDGMTEDTRTSVLLHCLSHVIKSRQIVTKNDGQEADDASGVVAEDLRQDQGFTRPKVLILLPSRNSAVRWVDLVSKRLPLQADGKKRFEQEYGTRDDENDPRYLKKPKDFREALTGNVDDTFRIGLRVMKKEVKLYSQFYSSDILIASPLGLRAIIDENE